LVLLRDTISYYPLLIVSLKSTKKILKEDFKSKDNKVFDAKQKVFFLRTRNKGHGEGKGKIFTPYMENKKSMVSRRDTILVSLLLLFGIPST